jgi:hypothetical protein
MPPLLTYFYDVLYLGEEGCDHQLEQHGEDLPRQLLPKDGLQAAQDYHVQVKKKSSSLVPVQYTGIGMRLFIFSSAADPHRFYF